MAVIDTKYTPKFGMYCERLSDRPRIMKHVLVCHASRVPVDNQFKARKAKPKIPVENESLSQDVDIKSIHSKEQQACILEQEFMERFDQIKDEPDEVKFPVLRASHPGGKVFKTHHLGVAVARTMFIVRHPFNLKDPNSPAPVYSCYYDKHMQRFFTRPPIVKKLVTHGIITEDGYIREPYKIFKDFVEKKKAPFGRSSSGVQVSPISSASSTPRVAEKPGPMASTELADDQIKSFLSKSYNLEADTIAQLYSGVSGRRRKSNSSPNQMTDQNSVNYRNQRNGSPLPPLRCNTPMRLATLEIELQQQLHNSRMTNVLETREKLELNRKATVIEQRFVKDKILGDNKKQIQLNREDSRRFCLRNLFNKKKESTIKKRQLKEEENEASLSKKVKNTRRLKLKFASAFIKGKLHETEIKAERVKKEEKAKNRNARWLANQEKERKAFLSKERKRMYRQQMYNLAAITVMKSGKIAQLQMKCEYYDKNIDDTIDINKQLQERLAGLQQLQKVMEPHKLDGLQY